MAEIKIILKNILIADLHDFIRFTGIFENITVVPRKSNSGT